MTAALVDAAVAGTGRKPVPDGAFASPAAALVPEGIAAERRVLLAAGGEAVRSFAGRLAARGRPALPEAPPESLPACSPAAAALLAEIAAQPSPGLLDDATALLAAARQRVPHELLPAWMGAVTASASEAPCAPVLGERGRWLAALNPGWAHLARRGAAAVVTPEDERAWQEGDARTRLQVLAHCRAADPALARTWLGAAWKSERAQQRAQFLDTLEPGLSLADEPLLESALDDRSQEVRASAQRLLARLPDTAYAQRMTARADAILRVEGGRLAPEPPEELPQEWTRDLAAPDPVENLGLRARILASVVGRVPPSHWETRFRAPPEKLVPVARKTDWRDALLHGWRAAACRFGAASWALPLVAEFGREPVAGGDAAGAVPSLLALLTPEDAAGPLLARVGAAMRDAAGRSPLEFWVLGDRWPPAFADGWLAALRETYDPADRWPHRLGLQVAERALPVARLADVLAILDARRAVDANGVAGDEAQIVRNFRWTASLRVRLAREIRP